MKRSKSRHLPKARTSGILTREIPGELLIYDMKRHAAYCLNETAASIWKQCNGKRTIIELVRRLEKSCKVPVDERIVWLALNQLEKRHLLDPRFSFPSQRVMSRRGLMSSLGLATAVALPIVVSIIAPTAVQAATCGGKIPVAQCDNVSKVGCCCTINLTCTQTLPGVFICILPAC